MEKNEYKEYLAKRARGIRKYMGCEDLGVFRKVIADIKPDYEFVKADAIRINDYESLCYAIYFAMRYDFVLDAFETDYKTAQQDVINSKDCLLLTFTWLYFMKQNHWNRTASQVKPLNRVAMNLKNKENDMDRYWLFCYEALTYGSLAGEWRTMKQAGVTFIRRELIDGIAGTDTKSN